eukprot:Plantae.Rhodophyta-Palmaria_palmata.ctg6346.p1 GENE.Plantae.Rhodophyta-Palmaria_palmata.ctg6346~~Plantae.Rhodophyta-Palmaria_palmata.ctg6346.p1  ORF type:complete len:247 (+),score=13.96 Plantae.Rhodophyta-Palmaria_palmata.ctg6346:310-1050(+)
MGSMPSPSSNKMRLNFLIHSQADMDQDADKAGHSLIDDSLPTAFDLGGSADYGMPGSPISLEEKRELGSVTFQRLLPSVSNGTLATQRAQVPSLLVGKEAVGHQSFDRGRNQSFEIGKAHWGLDPISPMGTLQSPETLFPFRAKQESLKGDKSASSRGVVRKTHVCFCGRAFNKREHLKRHNLLVHQEVRPFTCEECDLHFGTKQNHQVHLSTRKHRQRVVFKRGRQNLGRFLPPATTSSFTARTK